jgi:phosphohistidine swiveling domain-containing protein
MSYVRWFDDIKAGEVDLVGGKGANLGEMARADFPVPPGFCLVAPAYRDFVTETGLHAAIGRVLDETDVTDAEDVAAKAATIRDLITEQAVPEAIADDALSAYRRLAREMGSAEPDGAPVAVRSSATAEDLPDASFAGQQDTYLNVRGEEALLEHISRCWASLWTARAVTYRAKQGFDHQKVYLSVVVQAMVPSEISGIMFTANPVSGARGEAVINASWGLGEAVVSGLVSPDTVTVNKKDGRVLSYELGAKERKIVYNKGGGTVELDTSEADRGVRALDSRQAAALAALGCQVEEHYGSPQDIEWGYYRDKWYLLQARPITTLSEESTIEAGEGEYNRTMFVEIFPDPLSPIFLSVIGPMFKDMLDFTFRKLGFEEPEDIEAIGEFYNQPYFHREYIAAALGPLSLSVREALVSQIVNPFGAQEEGFAGELSLPFLGMSARVVRFMVRFPGQLPGLLEQYQNEVADVAALDVEKVSDAEIVSAIKELVFEDASKLLNYDFLMIAVIGRTYRVLGKLLEATYGADTDEVVGKLISGVTGNVTMETNKRIWDLAQSAKVSPQVAEILRQREAADALVELRRLPEADRFVEELDRFLAEYGHREIRMDILYPTWGEDPAPVLGFIQSYLDADEAQSPHRQQDRLVAEREELTAEVSDKVRRDLKGRLLLAPILSWIMDQTQLHTRERDTMHFELTRLFPPFRRLLLELGRRWTNQGLIQEKEDAFYLSLNELEELSVSPRPVQDLVKSRREAFALNMSRAWPDRIIDGREIYADQGTAGEEVAGQLRGLAGSPGVASGVCRVIHGPQDFGKLQKGEIMVAPLTNPVWTPLFAVAGGIVTEVGGILSHGAIVAREYGIPAVMSVAGATQRVPEGHTVVVDGNKGIVYVEEAGSG